MTAPSNSNFIVVPVDQSGVKLHAVLCESVAIQKIIQKIKIFVDNGGSGWYTKLAKQRRSAASASPPAVREEVQNAFLQAAKPAVCCRADALGHSRFGILGWRCFDH